MNITVEKLGKESSLEKGFRRLSEQFDRDPSTDNEFIQSRLQELAAAKNLGSYEISLLANGAYEGYISPDQNVRRAMIVEPYRLDDPEVYAELLRTCREFKKSYSGQPLQAYFLPSVQYAVARYFGGFSGDQWENMNLYLDRTSAYSGPLSISEFKGKGVAVCAEKAPVAQNLIVFAGAQSRLVNSPKCRIPAESKEAAHYYNIISANKGDFIFDPTNPSEIRNVGRGEVSYAPSIHKISKTQLAALLAGGEVEVMHQDFETDETGQMTANESKWIYGGPMRQ